MTPEKSLLAQAPALPEQATAPVNMGIAVLTEGFTWGHESIDPAAAQLEAQGFTVIKADYNDLPLHSLPKKLKDTAGRTIFKAKNRVDRFAINVINSIDEYRAAQIEAGNTEAANSPITIGIGHSFGAMTLARAVEIDQLIGGNRFRSRENETTELMMVAPAGTHEDNPLRITPRYLFKNLGKLAFYGGGEAEKAQRKRLWVHLPDRLIEAWHLGRKHINYQRLAQAGFHNNVVGYQQDKTFTASRIQDAVAPLLEDGSIASFSMINSPEANHSDLLHNPQDVAIMAGKLVVAKRMAARADAKRHLQIVK